MRTMPTISHTIEGEERRRTVGDKEDKSKCHTIFFAEEMVGEESSHSFSSMIHICENTDECHSYDTVPMHVSDLT